MAGGDIDQLKIYVGNLPPGEALSKKDLKEHFSQYGPVVEVTIPVNKFKKEPFAFAFITFSSASRQLPVTDQTCQVTS